MGRLTRKSDGGLCVVNLASLDDADDDSDDVFAELHADTWRVVPISRSHLHDDSQRKFLRMYFESDIVDGRGYWVYRKDGTNWVAVEKDSDFKVEQGKSRRVLLGQKNGKELKLLIFDFAETLILILPPGIGVSEAPASTRATVKGGRLMLFLLSKNSTEASMAQVQLVSNVNGSAIREMVANLNLAYHNNQMAQSRALESSFQQRDQTEKREPDRTIQVALLSTLVACIGVIMAAAALTQGWIREFGISFGSIAAVLSLAWLISLQIQSRPARPNSASEDRMLDQPWGRKQAKRL